MANKAIISIDIDDTKFKEFNELFQKFQKDVESMPNDWAAVNNTIKMNAAAMGMMASAINSASTAQKQFNNHANQGAKTIENMAKSASNLGSHIFGIGKYLLKLGAIGSSLTGIGGIFGALGFMELANDAVSSQRAARGLNLNVGRYKSFGLDFSRFIDPSILSNVADAQNSYKGRVWLSLASGLNQNQIINQGPDQLASKLLIKAHDWWNKTPEAQRTEENLRATGFLQSGFNLEDMRRLGSTPLSELKRAQSQYNSDINHLNIADKNVDLWYGFERQVKLAGKTIETVLSNKLSQLSPSLSSLTESIEKDAEILIKGIFTPENIKSLSDSIKYFAEYLSSPDFKKDIKSFVDDIKGIAHAIHSALSFLGITGGDKPTPQTPPALDPNEVQRETKGLVRADGKSPYSDGISFSEKAAGYALHAITMPNNPKSFLADLDKKNNLPEGTLDAVWAKETDRGKSLVGPALKNGDQAIGDFQFLASAWKDWGHCGNRFRFVDEAKAAGGYLNSLSKRYNGDLKKALAAYNWGAGNLDKDIAAHGAQWESFAPNQTRDYVDKIVSALAKQKVSVKVNVTNQTSARVAVQANAAAIGN